MSRKTFLTGASLIAFAIGTLALLGPEFLLGTLKAAVPTPDRSACLLTRYLYDSVLFRS
jgi:hypothetical protein